MSFVDNLANSNCVRWLSAAGNGGVAPAKAPPALPRLGKKESRSPADVEIFIADVLKKEKSQ